MTSSLGRKAWWKALTAAIAVSCLSALPAQAAPVPPPVRITECGQSIDHDAYLARDLTCSTEFGILVEQVDPDGPIPNVMIDLRGHTLRGPHLKTGCAQDHIGVAGFGYPGPGVSIDVRNGRVDDWGIGVTSEGGLTVNKLRVSNNQIGLFCNCGGVVSDSVIQNNDLGTSVTDGGGLKLSNNIISGNKVGSSFGSITSGDYSRNSFAGNGVGVQINWGAVVHLRQNSFASNGTGVLAVEADNSGEYGQAILERNIFLANGNGVYLPEKTEKSNNHRLSKNLAIGNKRYGLYAPGSTDLGGNHGAGNGKACVGVTCGVPGR